MQRKFWQILTNFEIAELWKGVHCVDLGENFQTHIFLQNFVSIQPRKSPITFAASRVRGWFAGAAPDGSSCAMPLSFLAAERIQD